MMFLCTILFTLGVSSITAFLPIKSTIHRVYPLRVNMADPAADDMNAIYRYKSLFFKEDYNDVLKDIAENKVSKLIIHSNYKELVSVDATNDDSVYTHYHLTELNPLLVPKIVDKGLEFHIPVYFARIYYPTHFYTFPFTLIHLFSIDVQL
jgi:acetylglutamate synthase